MSTLQERRVLTQAEFDAFARLSGDDNPIHVDPAFAARTRFGRPVAHGALLVSLLTRMAERLAPGTHLTGQAIRFPAPAYAGEELVLEVSRLEDHAGGAVFGCRIARLDGQVTCDGTLTVSTAAAP